MHYCSRVLICMMLSFGVGLSAFSQNTELDSLFAVPLDNRDAIVQQVDKAVASYKQRVIVEPFLIKVLNSSSQSAETKEFIAQQLYRICDEDTVPAFSKLLYRRGTGTIAAHGLEIIPHHDAHNALVSALRKASGTTLAKVIGALGRRRDPEVIEQLRRFVQSGNSSAVEAALIALGDIGGEEAAQLLGMGRINVRRSLRKTATTAYLQCGWNSLKDGNRDTALTVFESLLIEVEPLEIREQALRGYILTEEEYAIPLIVEVLRGNEPTMQAIAAEEASKIEDVRATEALVEAFTDVKPPIQLQIVQILGERGDAEGMPTVIQSINNRDASVRLEALRTISKFNHPDSLHVLLKTVSAGSEEEQEIAGAALVNLSGRKIDEALVKSAMSADNAVRLEAVRLMAQRESSIGIPALVRIAERDVKEIRFEALIAIGVLGSVEQLELMVSEWTGAWSREQRMEIGEGIVSIALRSPPGDKRVSALHSALRRATEPEVQVSIIRALDAIQEDASVSALRALMRKASANVQSEIIQILIAWDSAEVLSDLEKLARNAEDAAVRDQAFAGYVRLLAETADYSESSTVKMYQRAVKIADTTEKRRLLLPGVAKLSSDSADKIWDALAEDSELADEIETLRK